ncbi:hypothetical protein U9M48_000340 [Paspalum notatum var. saurae]|uniref:RING-type domain-containing protein n=1 Tax=Paspalum notatum var. saurae TaxID=547442 RepID=A0AAQ3PDZ0_PASNO
MHYFHASCQQQPPAPAPAASSSLTVDMAFRSAALVVCTYRKADGWAEATCAVCLAELADGVSVRVLPVCMHYFHAACVGEWLLVHHTCPLCGAPLDAAAAVLAALVYFLIGIITMVGFIFCMLVKECCRHLEEADAAGRGPEPTTRGGGGSLRAPPRMGRAGERVVARPQQPVAAVEMVRSKQPEALVCTYRRADGWPEATCAVCLAELDDGVAVRVLPVCMHYFHSSCVGEWLLTHLTCPLCRAPLHPGAGASS